MLQFLVYVSTAVRELNGDELAHLVKRASERNADAGVTGLLLYSGGDFMQCLEGERSAIDLIYGIIQADPLHKGIILLARDSIEAREFSDWHMAFKSPDWGLTSLTGSIEPGFLESKDPGMPSRPLTLLRNFWRNHVR